MSDYETPDIYEEKVVTSRKRHKCCECYRTIKKGQKYQRVSGIWNGTWGNYKTCLTCVELREELTWDNEPPPFEELREWAMQDDKWEEIKERMDSKV